MDSQNTRFKAIRIVYTLSAIAIVIRLGYWQIIQTDSLTAMAEGQRVVSQQVIAPRGDILFADKSVLASSQPYYLVFAQPQIIKRERGQNDEQLTDYKKKFSSALAPVLWEYENRGLQVDEESKKIQIKEMEERIFGLLSKQLSYISLGKKVDIETKERLEKLNLVGLGFDRLSARFYPEGSSSAHLLGFVGSDAYGNDTGYFGLEGFYNGELRGRPGTYTQEHDALGLPILIGKFTTKEPKEGKTLLSSIDRTVQYVLEEKLKKGIEKYEAKGAQAIVMDPKTGEILAMASFPNYDPAMPERFPKETYRNPITADGYEPGSTFKVLIMAAGINEGLIKPDTKCDSCGGPISIGGFTIRTWNNKYQKDATMADVLIHSDNTGMVFVSQKLGIDKTFDYIKKFGFGDVTGIDLQDEHSPDLRPKNMWREIDLATASFGQGISTTALQVVRAVASVANGGKLVEPHIVKEITDERGKVYKIYPKVVGEPITMETAKTVTEMMVKAVDEGESKFAKPKGFKVAGKTGTAQIPIAGHYDPTKTIASFVGFAPADDPKFVMLVKYIEPTSSIYGSETAAPTFFEIAKELFTYYNIMPDQ